MQIFNTLTRQKEEFVPQVPGEYRIYVCGPTVYNYIHIGNARPLIVFDTLRRYLEYRGNKVIYVSNITDIDDKLIKKGQEEGTSMKEVAQRFEAEYLKDAAGLNCEKPTVQPRATEHIPQILDIVKDLIDSGHAYVAKNGDVYFRVKSDPGYGKLSHLNLDDLESGNRELRSRMEDDLKEDPADFAVWKAAKPGEPAWESPYGMGRPGWHIECSAMSRTHLGKTIDLHCGGQDLIFPHHENEIAQSECANGCEMCIRDRLGTESRRLLADKPRCLKIFALQALKLFGLFCLPYLCIRFMGLSPLGFWQVQLLTSLMLFVSNALPNVAGMGSIETAFLLVFGSFLEQGEVMSVLKMCIRDRPLAMPTTKKATASSATAPVSPMTA